MTPPRKLRFVISCEHGGNNVPQQYAALFQSAGAKAWLKSHRAYDPGARAATQQIAAYLSERELLYEEPVVATTTRLLVDINRSIDNPSVWSKFTVGLPESTREDILREFYEPHRAAVRDLVDRVIAKNEVAIHLSIHSFTPRIRGQWRPLEIGLLFDPQRSDEAVYCQQWAANFASDPVIGQRIRLRSNEPYAGTDDGLTTTLRRSHAAEAYLGIEIEINNRFYRRSPGHQVELVAQLCQGMPRQLAARGIHGAIEDLDGLVG